MIPIGINEPSNLVIALEPSQCHRGDSLLYLLEALISLETEYYFSKERLSIDDRNSSPLSCTVLLCAQSVFDRR
jgi:hypothetical protein